MEMPQPEETGHRVPGRIVETVNKVVLPDIGPAPTPQELAEKFAIPVENVLKILEIARRPSRLVLDEIL
jgi:hypothetical protein